MLKRMGFVKRRASTKSKVSIEDFEEKKQFLLDIKAVVNLEDIPLELIETRQVCTILFLFHLGQWLRRGLRE